jgi:hypothetical protein
MSDKPKCNACGLEIHRDSGIAYMGHSVRHKHISDCIQPLTERIAELEKSLEFAQLERDNRTSAYEVGVKIIGERKERITELERQLAEAKEDAADLDWLEAFVNHEGALVLHTGNADVGKYPGLGLRPGHLVRTLREAIRSARNGGE